MGRLSIVFSYHWSSRSIKYKLTSEQLVKHTLICTNINEKSVREQSYKSIKCGGSCHKPYSDSNCFSRGKSVNLLTFRISATTCIKIHMRLHIWVYKKPVYQKVFFDHCQALYCACILNIDTYYWKKVNKIM